MRFDFRFKRLKNDSKTKALIKQKIKKFNASRPKDDIMTYVDGPKYINDICHNLLEVTTTRQIFEFIKHIAASKDISFSDQCIKKYIKLSNDNLDMIWDDDQNKDVKDKSSISVKNSYRPAINDENIEFNTRLAKKHFEYYTRHNGDFEKFKRHFGYEFTSGTLLKQFRKYILKDYTKWKYKTGQYDKKLHFIDRDKLDLKK